MLNDVANKVCFLQEVRFATAVATINLINALTMISLIALLLAMIERNSATFDLIADRRRRAAKFSSNCSDRVAVF